MEDTEDHQDQVHKYIENTLAAALNEMSSPDGQPAITVQRRSPKASFYINPVTGALDTNETNPNITYTWPGRDVYETWKFTVMFRILAAISEAIHAGLVISKRDIYYSDPTCFGSQRVVDSIVDDFAHTIGVDRAALNVEATAKGLAMGHYQVITKSHEVLDARLSDKDSLISRIQEIDHIDTTDVKWVLIIEKEAVYRRLARSSYHTKAAAGKGILITGKGYPDLCTRAFIRKISESRQPPDQTPRFYALVDSDPDGMAIMATYKYGSIARTQANARLNLPSLCWLGLRTSDVVAGAGPFGDDALIRLTARDRKKTISLLSNNPVWASDGPELEWRAELQQMLMLNLKAELEILYDRNGGLERWIDQKMATVC